MKHIVITINHTKISCPAGSSILDAATANGIYIPTLCHHPELKPYGACRMCLVEDEKSKRLFAACVTPAAPDMAVLTDTPRIIEHRRNIVRLMIAEHPESCIVCNKGNRCELRKIAANLGVSDHRLYPMPNYKPYEEHNPFIIRDLSKCVLCAKCIRADHELVGVGAIDYVHRGFRSRPATLFEAPLEKSNCTFCGTCVSVCPTGALSVKNKRYTGTPDREADSICMFCSVGCNLLLGISEENIVDVNPSLDPNTVNGTTLCVRGHFAGDFIQAADRLAHPMIRSADTTSDACHSPVAWDQAIDMVVQRLLDIKKQYGPQSIAFIGSSTCSNEENYLFQKIARVCLGTANVVNSADTSGQRLIRFVEEKTHGICRTAPLADLENAQAILVLSADSDHVSPVAGYHIKRAARKNVPLIVIDSYKTDLASLASYHIAPRKFKSPGTGYSEAINLLSRLLIDEDACDHEFIHKYTDRFEDFKQSALALDAEQTAVNQGIDLELLKKSVEAIKGRKMAFVIGADILNFPDGYLIMEAVFNLALLTGSIGEKKGAFFIPLVNNNAMGAMDMGTVPDLLPGRHPIQSDADRQTFEKLWQAKLSPDPGLDMVGFLKAAKEGQIKAAYIMGQNPVRSLPQSSQVIEALKNLEFLVVQDLFYTRSAQLADVILPGATAAEKDGSFTNMEGRIQTFTSAIKPPQDARADWQILSLVVQKSGYPVDYKTIETIRQEIQKVIPMYVRLGKNRHDWIQNNDLQDRFSFTLVSASVKTADDDLYPYWAMIGSLRCHLGSGSRTNRSQRVRDYQLDGLVEICPQDCKSLGLGDNGQVLIKSRHGSIQRGFKQNRNLALGQVLIPKAVNENDAMNLIDLTQSAQTGCSVCQVSIERI